MVENGNAIKITILENGKEVELALGYIERKRFGIDRTSAWIEVGGNRYSDTSMYSGGYTGGGFNMNYLNDLNTDGIKVLTRDPAEALKFMEAADKESENRSEKLKQAKHNAVKRINLELPTETILRRDAETGKYLFLLRSEVSFRPGYSNNVQFVIELKYENLPYNDKDRTSFSYLKLSDYRPKTRAPNHKRLRSDEKMLFGTSGSPSKEIVSKLVEFEAKASYIRTEIARIVREEEKALGL